MVHTRVSPVAVNTRARSISSRFHTAMDWTGGRRKWHALC